MPSGSPGGARRESVASRVAAALLAFAFVAAIPIAAPAHVIMGTKSLHLRVVESKLVVRGRVVDPEAVFVSADGKTRRGLVEIEILEVIKGSIGDDGVATEGARHIRFAQDGHDVPRYARGQEALFFLAPIAASIELRSLAVPGGPTHVSSEEHHEVFIPSSTRWPILLSAVRAYAEAESAPTGKQRVASIRNATLELLTSGDTQLATTALSSLVLTPQAALVTSADLPRLEEVIADRGVSMGFRAGLITELERRGLIDGATYRLSLLRSAAPTELASVIRSVGPHPSDASTAFFLELLTDPETKAAIAAEAAMALGTSRSVAAVGALSKALENPAPRVRNAAIRGLGQIGGPEARQALERAAAAHPDPMTQRRAVAELRSAATRGARSD